MAIPTFQRLPVCAFQFEGVGGFARIHGRGWLADIAGNDKRPWAKNVITPPQFVGEAASSFTHFFFNEPRIMEKCAAVGLRGDGWFFDGCEWLEGVKEDDERERLDAGADGESWIVR